VDSSGCAGAGVGTPPFTDEPFPPREAGDITELASSMRLHGVTSPLLVRIVGFAFQVVCGHRRFVAAKAAGLREIPALVCRMDDAEALRCHLADNLAHREEDDRAPREVLAVLEESAAGVPFAPDRMGSSTDRMAGVESSRTAGMRGEGLDFPASADSLAPQAPSQNRLVNIDMEPQRDEDREEQRTLDRLLLRTASFLKETRAMRAINVARAEILLESILEAVEDEIPLDIFRRPQRPDGDTTALHSVLVTAICAHAARGFKWSEERTRDFLLGAFLHDVGMVFLTGTKLEEARALRSEERLELQSHTRLGCALISATGEWDEQVAFAARDHHERWNGSGYPAGKRGAAVDFPARLLGLLDTYAALLESRPHRDALDPPFARERLAKAMELGLFDPSLQPFIAEKLPAIRLIGATIEGIPETLERRRNSIEMRGELVTMLAKGST
jgi:HD-GYP domain-containing protein (c-di-GMP phosphodiesterase class II)